MSDTITPTRLEPIVDTGRGPVAKPEGPPVKPSEPPVLVTPRPEEAPYAPIPPVQPTPPVRTATSTATDILARIEDKTSRIEEKLARSEAATQRVVDRFEAASHRMSEVAQQSDLNAVKGEVKFIARRVRALPGFSAVILASIITAVLTAVIAVAIVRFAPGLVGLR